MVKHVNHLSYSRLPFILQPLNDLSCSRSKLDLRYLRYPMYFEVEVTLRLMTAKRGLAAYFAEPSQI